MDSHSNLRIHEPSNSYSYYHFKFMLIYTLQESYPFLSNVLYVCNTSSFSVNDFLFKLILQFPSFVAQLMVICLLNLKVSLQAFFLTQSQEVFLLIRNLDLDR